MASWEGPEVLLVRGSSWVIYPGHVVALAVPQSDLSAPEGIPYHHACMVSSLSSSQPYFLYPWLTFCAFLLPPCVLVPAWFYLSASFCMPRAGSGGRTSHPDAALESMHGKGWEKAANRPLHRPNCPPTLEGIRGRPRT